MSSRSRASQPFPQTASVLRATNAIGRCWARAEASRIVPRILQGVALVLLGGVAGLAIGQAMAARSAHRTGACAALNMAAALGYLDAEQQRRVRHALASAVNPDVELLAGKPSLRDGCDAAAGG